VRVLFVEDDQRIANLVARGLREKAYAVDVADSGPRAVQQLGVNNYDIVILDVLLPGKSGFEVCEEIRKTGNTVPVLMLTARDAVDDRVRGLNCGADDYLTKPFAFEELLARLRALLRRSWQVRPSRIVIADLEIDTVSQRVWRAQKRIVLTAKEYALLEYLATEKGKVVGRAEIAEHVWDETFEPFSNSIEVYIRRLRNKIDTGYDLHLIRTRRGAGYILDDV
jgi:two-component system copper resistance phosphate regulon response regulator CusR